MKKTSYISLWNVEFVLLVDNNEIVLIPKSNENYQKFNSHFDDHDFIINYDTTVGSSSTFIERVEFGFEHSITLIPKYSFDCCHKDFFSGFEIMGESIDDFFSPSRYFYDRAKKGYEQNVDFIYHSEVADKWTIIFENNPITVTLSYGDILREGVESDLMLHPKLTVVFEKTTDIQYVYRVYSLIIRFLQIVRYDTKCGKLRIVLFYEEQGNKFYNGGIHDFCMDPNQFCIANHDVEYGCFKPYIKRILQFAAENPMYTFYHYPKDGSRYRGIHYSASDYMSIFSAFEAECLAEKKIFENVDQTKIQVIKETLVSRLDEYPTDCLNKEEMDFLNNAKKRILQLGTQFGQTQKIMNAYQVLSCALDSSIEHIFYLPEFKLKDHIQENDIKRIASFLASKRGTVAHGGFSGVFTDSEAQKIRFLEILTHAQVLKRIGLSDTEIERVIGVVFGCNYVYFHERYH